MNTRIPPQNTQTHTHTLVEFEEDYFEMTKKKKIWKHTHEKTDVYCHILHNLYKNVFDM